METGRGYFIMAKKEMQGISTGLRSAIQLERHHGAVVVGGVTMLGAVQQRAGQLTGTFSLPRGNALPHKCLISFL